MTILRAAALYWATVFALGFALGTVRVTWIVPLVGLLPANLIELPIILGGSWVAAGWVVRRFAIQRPFEALALGAIAFMVLMVAECVLAAVLTNQTPAQWFAGLRQPHRLLGLGGQVAFALMPWWRVQRGVSAA